MKTTIVLAAMLGAIALPCVVLTYSMHAGQQEALDKVKASEFRVEDSMRELCFQYRRWEQSQHERVGSMDRHCSKLGG
jgi:hypothetical protein